jgi:uncharacterized protein YbjT (DUF2867 family)
MKTALLAGATGLVGSFLLEQLIESAEYSKIKVITRRPLQKQHPKIQEIIVNFDQIESAKEQIQAEDYFCCLGTTIKKAGSKEEFRKIDYEYVFRLACLAREYNCQHFSVVSAMGASFSSPIFYNKVKAEMESALIELKFDSLLIFRPSLLLGPRLENRPGEKLAALISPILNNFLQGPLKDYRAIQALDVAKAMLKAAVQIEAGPHIFLSSEIQILSDHGYQEPAFQE